MKIPFNRPYMTGRELTYIRQAHANLLLSGNGPFTRKCQDWLQGQLRSPKVLLTHSCTAALEMAAILCDIGPGDEVIMPSFTFVSTANAVVLRGGVPVFVDIRPDTLNINETLVEKAVTDKTKAVVAVHYAGVGCAMDVIMDLADRYRLRVVEDAAQAMLSRHNGRYLGTIGDLGCLSFHETKNIISGEGGALLVNAPELIERAGIIWEKGTNRKAFFQGQVDKYTWVDMGSSFLPGELTAAFLYAQLEEAEKIIAFRKRVFDRYMSGLKALADKGLIGLPFVQSEYECNGHMFYTITRSLEDRTRLMEFLLKNRIYAVFHYVPLHSSPAGKKYGRAGSAMDVTDDVSDRLLRLPLYYEMTDTDVDRVVKSITDFYTR